MLLRKGNKSSYKEIAVPVESEIVRNFQRQEEADRLEKERVKKLTLQINERQEEEEVNEAIAAVSTEIIFRNITFLLYYVSMTQICLFKNSILMLHSFSCVQCRLSASLMIYLNRLSEEVYCFTQCISFFSS